MVNGVPFNPKVADVVDALRRTNGNITEVSKYYSVSRESFYQYIYKHPEIKPIIDELRSIKDESLLDAAEGVIAFCLNQREKQPKIAIDAAKYVLDNKGRRRDWGITKNEADIRGVVQDKISADIRILYEQAKGE